MNILVLLAHPVEGSLNHGIAERVKSTVQKDGHELYFHDLYAEGFDPLLTPEEMSGSFEPTGLLKQHCEELKSADGVVIIHPNWRDQVPAILKGWVDRVIRSGVAFEYSGVEGEEGHCLPLLSIDKICVFVTSDCSFEYEESIGHPIKTFWENFVFGSCGVKETHYKNFCDVFLSSPEIRSSWLDEVETIVSSAY